jgi:hypothetical protein
MKNKPGIDFIMTTVIGGLVFLVPLMFLVRYHPDIAG